MRESLSARFGYALVFWALLAIVTTLAGLFFNFEAVTTRKLQELFIYVPAGILGAFLILRDPYVRKLGLRKWTSSPGAFSAGSWIVTGVLLFLISTVTVRMVDFIRTGDSNITEDTLWIYGLVILVVISVLAWGLVLMRREWERLKYEPSDTTMKATGGERASER